MQLRRKAGFAASDGWSVRPENMKKKTRKPKKCEWVEGFCHSAIASLTYCESKPVFEVQVRGVTVAHVCTAHAIPSTQHGYQIR